jgi:S-formylglutathione hydrolase
MNAPWGQKAFSAYLGEGKDKAQQTRLWENYDATVLVSQTRKHLPLLIDQGLEDEFLAEQLGLTAFEAATTKAGYEVQIYRHSNYDHSYYFIATFIEAHLRFHGQYLKT